MNRKYFLIGTLVIIGVLAISAFSWAAINRAGEAQSAQTADLTSFNAADVSAYRWNAMAKFYAAQQAQAE